MATPNSDYRDPIDQDVLAAAVAAWLANQPSDEADALFEAVLLTQGVISPADVIESIEPGDDGDITMLVEGDNEIWILADGQVMADC